MPDHELLILQGLGKLYDEVEAVQQRFIRGLIKLILWILIPLAIIYFLWFIGKGFFTGHWIRSLILLCIWPFIEFIYWIG